MIQFSTLPSGLYPADDIPNEMQAPLSEKEQLFLQMIRRELNKELKEPSPESLNFIKAYSLFKRA